MNIQNGKRPYFLLVASPSVCPLSEVSRLLTNSANVSITRGWLNLSLYGAVNIVWLSSFLVRPIVCLRNKVRTEWMCKYSSPATPLRISSLQPLLNSNLASSLQRQHSYLDYHYLLRSPHTVFLNAKTKKRLSWYKIGWIHLQGIVGRSKAIFFFKRVHFQCHTAVYFSCKILNLKCPLFNNVSCLNIDPCLPSIYATSIIQSSPRFEIAPDK